MQEKGFSFWFQCLIGTIGIVASLYFTYIAILHHHLTSVVLLQNGTAFLFGLCALVAGFNRRVLVWITGISCVLCLYGVGFAKWQRGEDTFGGAIGPCVASLAALALVIVLKRRSRKPKDGS